MKLLLTLLLFNMTLSAALSQTPGVQWQVNSKADYDVAAYLATSDSGLIVATNQLSKLNKDGLLLWQIPLTTDSSFYYYLKLASDGNYFLIGNTPYDTADAGDIRVLKFSGNGRVLWDQRFGGSETEELWSAEATPDGGCVVLARSNSNDGDVMLSPAHPYDFDWGDGWILKVDASGQQDWATTFGAIGKEGLVKVINNGSGGVVVAYHEADSNNYTFSGSYAKLINFDASGNLLWKKSYADSTALDDLINIPGGGFLLAGGTYRSHTIMDSTSTSSYNLYNIWLAKLNANGDVIWQNTYGDNNIENYMFFEVYPLANGGYALAGSVERFRFDSVIVRPNGNVTGAFAASDAFLLNVDGNGNMLFKKTFGGSNYEFAWLKVQSNNEQVLAIVTSSSDGYFAGGYNQPGNALEHDVWLIKLDGSGNALWKGLFGGTNDDVAGIELLLDDHLFLTGTSNSFEFGGLTHHGVWITKVGPANIIKATVYIDANSNGIRDGSEKLSKDVKLTATKGSKATVAQVLSTGVFIMNVDTGTHTISVLPMYPYYTVVPAARSTTFSSFFNTDSMSFALQPVPGKQDLVINAIPLSPARPGFTTAYKLYYKNVGTTTIAAGEILFKRDSRLTLVSSSPNHSSLSGDTLKWNYINLAPSDTASITIELKVLAPPAVSNGDTLTSIALIRPVGGDETPSDDTAVIRHRVTGSFDPNDKYENNGGVIRPSHISKGDYLNYTIRFQNTGTDTAFGVTVRDTLATKLELASLQMVASSHPFQLSVKGGELTWLFSGIDLPDSTVNEKASHGFIAYRIKPKPTVALGDTIHNTASIYFDFNLPVLTNNAFTTVRNTIILPLKLLQFSGALQNNATRLHWATQGEYDFDRFVIERSGNGRDFVTIGTRLSGGNRSSITDYHFTDDLTATAGEVFFYRLKMIDVSGTVTYSAVLVVRRGTSAHPVTVFPNPVRNGAATVTITSEVANLATMKLLDGTGKSVWVRLSTLSAGTNSITIDPLSQLSQGVYTLQIVTSTQVVSKQIVIVR